MAAPPATSGPRPRPASRPARHGLRLKIFDAFTPPSHHGHPGIGREAERNRLLLMGLMTTAGWDFFRNQWWHYLLFNARQYPVLSDSVLPQPMM